MASLYVSIELLHQFHILHHNVRRNLSLTVFVMRFLTRDAACGEMQCRMDSRMLHLYMLPESIGGGSTTSMVKVAQMFACSITERSTRTAKVATQFQTNLSCFSAPCNKRAIECGHETHVVSLGLMGEAELFKHSTPVHAPRVLGLERSEPAPPNKFPSFTSVT